MVETHPFSTHPGYAPLLETHPTRTAVRLSAHLALREERPPRRSPQRPRDGRSINRLSHGEWMEWMDFMTHKIPKHSNMGIYRFMI